MVKHIGLRQVPWESWAHWVWVADEIFSGCNDRVTAAQNRIKAWQGRGFVPISVETTSVLTAIQQRDPYFNTELAPGDVLCDDMLGMMYAMAIQRLVNGVVDVSAKRNSTSVASRADWAGLPRLLVDIRHETAHNDLPGLPLLRSASKQALEWLKAHYWEPQRQALGKVREKLKVKLLEHCQLVVDILTPMSTTNDEGKDEDVDTEGKTRRVKVMRSMRNIHKRNLKAMKQERARVFQDLECLCLISTSELVSILVDDGLLEQGVLDGPEGRDNALLESGDSDSDTSSFDLEAATYTAWRYTICRLSSQLPRLPAMLLVAIVKRIGLSRPISGSNACTISRTGSVMPSLLSSERPDSPKKTENGRSSSTGLNLLIAWCGWLLESEYSEAAVESISQEAVKSQILGISWKINVKAGLTEELCRELMRSCLHLSLEREPLEQLVSWIALKIGSKKLQQQALMLSKFGSISQRMTVSDDKSGGSKERDSVIGSVASMQEVTTHGSLSGKAQEPSESCPDSSRKSHSITRTCDLDDSVYKMVKKQQHEVLARAASEGSGVGRGCVRGEAKDEFGPVTGGQAKGQLAGNRTPGLQGRRWTVAENWTPCAIGMIPSPYSVVGIIPPLDLPETGDTLEDTVMQRVTGNATINSVETTTVRKRKGDVDRNSPTSEQRAKEAGHHVRFRVLEKISENLQQFDADEHVDTLEDTVTGNATINSVETTTVTKRKGDVDQSSLSSEKRAKKDGHHVQFRGPEKMSENVHESRSVKELNGRKALDSKVVRHSGGTLLEGCLRQEDQQVLHVSPQQLEQLKAAIHTVA